MHGMRGHSSCCRFTLRSNSKGFDAYYALFYGVSGLLLEGGRQFKRHSGVRTVFNRDFVRTGRIEKRYGDLYNQLFDDRQAGDYVALTEFDAQYVQEKIEA